MVRDMINDDMSKLSGKILVSTPIIPIKYMKRTMIYVCKHDYEGTVGIIINKIIPGMEVHSILKRMHMNVKNIDNVNVNFGGPEEIDQCFILHSDDFMSPSSVIINNHVALTINKDLVKAITLNVGPSRKLLCMGCCLWEPYQLEDEISSNYWIPIVQDEALIFGRSRVDKWKKALLKIGSNSNIFASISGNA